MPNVAICLLTYKRTEYALKTVRAALSNVWCSYPLYLHIADNGSGREHIDAIKAEASKYALAGIGVSEALGGGYGHNYNVATQHLHPYVDYILMLEDDWILNKPLDLDRLIGVLAAGDACIRLGNIGVVQGIYASLIVQGSQMFWELNAKSPDQYIFSGNPRFETRGWERAVGPWPENLSPGETELAVGRRVAARSRVFWPLGQSPFEVFGHIGAERT